MQQVGLDFITSTDKGVLKTKDCSLVHFMLMSTAISLDTTLSYLLDSFVT